MKSKNIYFKVAVILLVPFFICGFIFSRSLFPQTVTSSSEPPQEEDLCSIPVIETKKYEKKMTWGVRTKPRYCAGRDFVRFARLWEYGTHADVIFRKTAKCVNVSNAKVWAFEELRDGFYPRTLTLKMTYELGDYLIKKIKLKNTIQPPEHVSLVATANVTKDSDVSRVSGIKHPYIVAICDGTPQLLVRAVSLSERNLRGIPDATIPDSAKSKPTHYKNIIHLMLDAVSNNAFHRSCKNLTQFLHNLEQNTSSPSRVYTMKHQNSVSCCSPGNQIPAYSGTISEKGDHFQERDPYPNSTDWIWNIAEKLGFKTFWGTDTCPGAFGREYEGFPSTQTRVIAPLCLRDVPPGLHFMGCALDTPGVEVPLTGLESFWTRYPDDRKFAVLNYITSHEPSEKMNIEIDYVLAPYFRHLEATGVLDDTIIIFWSDHGIQYGHYFHTPSGKLENMLPFLHFVLPRKLVEASPKIDQMLRFNANRLTTPYDLYETVRQLLYYPNPAPTRVPDPNNPLLPSERNAPHLKLIPHGVSTAPPSNVFIDLFGTYVPYNRSCYAAAIPTPFCSCLSVQNRTHLTMTGTTLESDALRKVVEEHHRRIAPYKDRCHEIKVEKGVMERISQSKGQSKGIVHIHYLAEGIDAHFSATLVPNEKTSSYELISLVRVDKMKKKCGIVGMEEQLCVCK